MVKINKFILAFLGLFFSSCYTIHGEPMIVPAALPPSLPYNFGQGEAGLKTTGFLPGPDLKLGLGKHVEISGTYYPYPSLYELLEGWLDVGISDKRADTIGFGVGDYISITEGYHDNHYFIYQGFYPTAFRISKHFSIRPLIRAYEYFGNYHYDSDPNGIILINKFSGVEIMPEIDGLLDWQHFGFRLGFSLPIFSSIAGVTNSKPILQWDTSSDIVYFVPMLSIGLYGKW